MRIRKAPHVPWQRYGFVSCRLSALMLAAALLLGCTAPQTEDGPLYRSERGYAIALPSQWLVVNRLEIEGRENPIGTDNARIRGIFTAQVLSALKEKALASGVELFVNLETSDEVFIESINVQTVPGSIAYEDGNVGYACAETEKQLTALYGIPVRMGVCKALKVRRMPALYMEYEVQKPNMAHIQYLIQLRTDRYVVMTLTCRPANLPRLRAEFDAIVASFRAI